MAKVENLNVRQVEVAVNEIITPFSINRNLQKLLDNDRLLYEAYRNVLGGNSIMEYVPYSVTNREYVYGDQVWFLDNDKHLWILKCVVSANRNTPQLAIDDRDDYGQPLFEKYGWQNQNKYISIDQTDIAIYVKRIVQTILGEHEHDSSLHEYGRIIADKEDEDYIGRKLMLRDLSNADPDREHYLFPTVTGHISDDTILNGTYVVWDSGIIEFDLVFRLGYVGKNEYGVDVLTCNNVKFDSTPLSPGAKEYQQNMKYFMSTEDGKIFMNRDGMETYTHSDSYSIQMNRNKFVNTYFGKLNLFPKPIQFGDVQISRFVNLDYMVFGTDNVTCGDAKTKTAYTGPNQMTWCDKTAASITAMLVTFAPDGECSEEEYVRYAKDEGIFSNTFSCHIIGRWK